MRIYEDDVVKMGDRFTLTCGHDGKVIWLSPDGRTFCVQGTKRSCQFCGKKATGTWTPTVYTFLSADAQ